MKKTLPHHLKSFFNLSAKIHGFGQELFSFSYEIRFLDVFLEYTKRK